MNPDELLNELSKVTTAVVKGDNPAAEPKTHIKMKPHEFRELVNELRDNALKFHNYQSLRELIIGVLNDNGIYPDHGAK